MRSWKRGATMRRVIQIGVVAIVGGLMGCAAGGAPRGMPPVGVAPSLVSRAGDPSEFLQVNAVALLPIEFDSRLRLVAEDRRVTAERDLARAFEREVGMRVVSTEEVRKGAPAEIQRDPAALGAALGVDGVIVTTVHQFVERDGSSIGAERPAMVDFSMRLVRAGTGKEIWRATYHGKDEALSENLLALGEQIGSRSVIEFRDAQGMLAAGFASAGRDLAVARQTTFER